MLAQAKRSEANPLTGSILKKPSLVEGFFVCRLNG